MAYKKTQTKHNKVKRNKNSNSNNKYTKKRNKNKKHKSLKRRIYNKIYSDGGGAAMSAAANDAFYPEEPLSTVPDRVFDAIPLYVSHTSVIVINKLREQILIYNRYINLIINVIHRYRVLNQKLDELINASTDVIETTNENFNIRIIDLYIRKFIVAEKAVDDAMANVNSAPKLTTEIPMVVDESLLNDISRAEYRNYVKEEYYDYACTQNHYNAVNAIIYNLKHNVIDKRDTAISNGGVVHEALKIAFHPSTLQRSLNPDPEVEAKAEADTNEKPNSFADPDADPNANLDMKALEDDLNARNYSLNGNVGRSDATWLRFDNRN